MSDLCENCDSRKELVALLYEKVSDFSGYVLGETIGKGSYATVKKATHKLTRQIVAIKIYKFAGSSGMDNRGILKEIRILESISHPNVVQFYESLRCKDSRSLVMEYCPGDSLGFMISDKRYLNEETAQEIFSQLTEAVSYLHSKRIAHLDIKPENVIVKRQKPLTVKLIDFGFSMKCSKKKKENISVACGTPCYMAPEVVSKKEYDGRSADVWSLGVLLYFMTVGKLPFDGKSTNEVHKRILKGSFIIPRRLNHKLQQLITSMLQMNPSERISVDELCRHPWLRGVDGRELSAPIHQIGKLNTGSLFVAPHEINREIMEELQNNGLSKHRIHNELSFEIHSGITTWYRLLHQQKVKDMRNYMELEDEKERLIDSCEGSKSLNSEQFNSFLLDHITRAKRIID